MLHKDVLDISYQHQYKIRSVFKEILGIHDIDHFSLDLVRPDGEMIFFSGTPSHAYEICKRGYGAYDGIISPDYYKNYEFYWWKDAAHKAYANKIDTIRSEVLGLKHGFMLVRKWDDFHLIYSFATKNGSLDFQTNVINQINVFLKIGDWAYNEMQETYSEYTGNNEPPKIESFFTFEGGAPPARYTANYQLNNAGLIAPKPVSINNVIHFDFSHGQRTKSRYE